MPVRITPTALRPASRAAERNSTSTDGRWPETGGPSCSAQQKRVPLRDQFEMMRARRDIDVARLDRLVVRRLGHRHRAFAVEPLGERRGEARRHVLRDQDRRAVGRQAHQHRLERLDAAGRGADQRRSCRRAMPDRAARLRLHGRGAGAR